MNDVGQLIRDANPIQGEPSLLADDELNALLLLAQTRSGNVDVQEVTKTVEPQKKRWNGWLIAAAAFAVVILFAGAAMLFAGPSSELPPATTPPTTQAAPTTTEAAVVEAAVVEEVEETTTTTTTLPFIRTGTYTVPDEVAPGTYRVWGSAAARLDDDFLNPCARSAVDDLHLIIEPSPIRIFRMVTRQHLVPPRFKVVADEVHTGDHAFCDRIDWSPKVVGALEVHEHASGEGRVMQLKHRSNATLRNSLWHVKHHDCVQLDSGIQFLDVRSVPCEP
jgi:hypothetical protein